MAWYFNLFVYLLVCPYAAFRNQENETSFFFIFFILFDFID